MGGGLTKPVPVVGPIGGRVFGDILTAGLAEALPSNIKDPFYHGMGSLFFSPLSGMAAGGAGLMGAGGIGGGGFGAAAPGTAGIGTPASGSAVIGSELSSGSTLSQTGGSGTASAGAGGATGKDMLQNAFLATSIGSMLGNAVHPPPLYPPAGIPAPPIGHSSGFTPVSQMSIQQLAQLMAQRRAQQTGKFTV